MLLYIGAIERDFVPYMHTNCGMDMDKTRQDRGHKRRKQ